MGSRFADEKEAGPDSKEGARRANGGGRHGGASLFARNATFLLILQLASYVLPFLLIPYLTRVLGIESYGVVAFGLATAQIGSVLTDYGFNLSATYQIAGRQTDVGHINNVIGAVFACKTALLIAVCLAVVTFALTNATYHQHWLFLSLMCLPVVGQTYQPVWFFQGVERMGAITIYTVVARSLFLVMVIFLVKGPSDIYIVALSNGLSQILAALVGVTMFHRMGYRVTWPGTPAVMAAFRESTRFFWSRAAVMIYTAGGSFFLGLAGTPVQLAHYSAAEQLYRGAQALYSSIPQALYPNMVRKRDLDLFFLVLKYVLGACAIGIAFGLLCGKWVLMKVYGAEYASSFPTLVVFICAFGLVAPSLLLGYPFLGAIGRIQAANTSVLWGGGLQIVSLAMLTFFKVASPFTVACSVFATELLVLVVRVIAARQARDDGAMRCLNADDGACA